MLVEDFCATGSWQRGRRRRVSRIARKMSRRSIRLNRKCACCRCRRGTEADEIAAPDARTTFECLRHRHETDGGFRRLLPSGWRNRARENSIGVRLGSVPPDGHLHTRYFCKRLRAQFPEMKIVVAILVGGNDPEARQKAETSVPADEMARSLAEAVAGNLFAAPRHDRAHRNRSASKLVMMLLEPPGRRGFQGPGRVRSSGGSASRER